MCTDVPPLVTQLLPHTVQYCTKESNWRKNSINGMKLSSGLKVFLILILVLEFCRMESPSHFTALGLLFAWCSSFHTLVMWQIKFLDILQALKIQM